MSHDIPYRANLARVHHLGFGGYADACAPDVLRLLEPVRRAGGVVLELGCGSGALTRHLADAGHRVIATDASPAMLELARAHAGAAEARPLVLPDDELPEADAVVSVGHLLNYLADADAIERALRRIAEALRPGGLLAVDVCDLRYGRTRADEPDAVRVEDDWALVTRYSRPRPDRFVRDITTFVRGGDGSWTRDDERHDTVLVDVASLPALLARSGVHVTVRPSFGTADLPDGLVVLTGRKRRR